MGRACTLGAEDPAVDLQVRSRGTHDWNVGRHTHPTMTRIAAVRGYNLSRHIASQVTADDLAWANDVVVTFDLERERVWGAETRIRAMSRRFVPSVDALHALVDRPPAHPHARLPERR